MGDFYQVPGNLIRAGGGGGQGAWGSGGQGMGAGPWEYSGNNTSNGYLNALMRSQQNAMFGLAAQAQQLKERVFSAAPSLPSIDGPLLTYLRARKAEWLKDVRIK